MKKISIGLLIFFLFHIDSALYGGMSMPTDSLNPKQFIRLYTRDYIGMDSVDINSLISFIRPSTNVCITFDYDYMKRCLNLKDRTGSSYDALADLKRLKEKKRIERDTILARPENKSTSKRDSIYACYKKITDSIIVEIQKLGFESKEIRISIVARLTLHSGTTYDLPVANYTSAKDSNYTAVVERIYKMDSNSKLDNFIVDAEVDLNSQKLSDGDVLDLQIDNTGDGVQRRYVKRFIISNYGWKVEFPTSLVFIKRTDEALDSLGRPINPSNFKPAAGGSLLLTYSPRGGIGERLWKGFGVGLNASLVDFERDKDFELGIGLVVYWLNRSIGFGYGWNIHGSQGSTLFCPERRYYFLSLDFLKTFDTFSGFLPSTGSSQ